MSQQTASSPNLFVPMNVDALAVGNDSNPWNLHVPDFASGLALNKVLGYQQFSDMWQNNQCPYDPGVHLRWALPDGLTQGHATEQDQPTYRDVPDRWVILRLVSGGSAATAPKVRAWIVESDFITPTKPAGPSAQWPVFPPSSAAPSQQFEYVQYVGRQLDFANWPKSDPAKYLKDIGANLTAVGYGDATFAAYYPACSSVFGFYDDLSDLTAASDSAPQHVTYLVSGWFSDPKLDALYGSENTANSPDAWETRMDALQWAWPSKDVPKVQPTRSIVHGTIANVVWKGRAVSYNYGMSSSATPKLGIGSSSLDALAAIVAAYAPGSADPEALEKILLAFQSDLLSSYDKPADLPAVEAELTDALHAASFGSKNTGIIFEVRRKDANAPAGSGVKGDAAPIIPFPGDVGSLLTKLNAQQSQLEKDRDKLVCIQQQLYYSWHKQSDGVTVDDAVLTGLADQIAVAKAAISSDEAALTATQGSVEAELAKLLPAYELSQRTGSRFWEPSDLSLLVANAGRTVRHGEDGQFAQTGKLNCRLSGDTLSEMSFTVGTSNPVHISTSAFGATVPAHRSGSGSADFDNAILPDLGDLLAEAILLDPAQTPYLASLDTQSGMTAAALEQEIAKRQAINWNAPKEQTWDYASDFTGVVPSQAAATYWLSDDGTSGNPWIPMLLQWELSWTPSYAAGSGVPDALQGWTFDGQDYQPDPAHAAPAGSPTTIDGITVLTPNAVWNLQQRLLKYNQANPHGPDKDSIVALISALSKVDILSQSAGGATLSLTMRDQSMQLPPIGSNGGLAAIPGGSGTILDTIDARYETGPWRASQLSQNTYLPVRAGHLSINRLNIVDAFGQVMSLSQSARDSAIISSSLKGQKPGEVVMRPRISQHTKLQFDLVSAQDDAVPTNSDPATNPVCGWLMANHLDESLQISSADGAVLGKLRLSADGTKVLWQADPVAGAAIAEPMQPLKNEHLENVRAAILAYTGDQFAKLTTYFEQMEETIHPPGSKLNARVSALMGTPIAVARARLGLQFDGTPIHDLSGDQTKVGDETDHGFSQITYPVALGDIGLLDDGLFGYFAPEQGKPATTDYDMLYLPGGANVSAFVGPHVSQANPADAPIKVSAFENGQPTTPSYVTLLLDPRGAVKARMGVLPAKTISIPDHDISAVLAAHEMILQTSPMLRGVKTLDIVHPSKKSGAWSWLTVEQDAAKADASDDSSAPVWKETTELGQKTGKSGMPAYPVMLEDGWLRLRVPSASGAAILYFSAVGGTLLVPKGSKVNLTWAANLPDKGDTAHLAIGDAAPKQVENQSPGTEFTINENTTFTLSVMNGDKLLDCQQLEVRVIDPQST